MAAFCSSSALTWKSSIASRKLKCVAVAFMASSTTYRNEHDASTKDPSTYTLDFQPVSDDTDATIDDLPADFGTGGTTRSSWKNRTTSRPRGLRGGSSSSLSEPSLHEKHEYRGGRASTSAELIVEDKRAGLEVGVHTQVEQFCYVVELRVSTAS